MTEVPLKPMGKEDIRKLELALIFGTLFRSDVIERIRNAEDRLTWLDSLVVAAAALARERAGHPVSRIAEEVGRSEATIRNHLQGKTEASKLVKDTYNLLVKQKGVLELKLPEEISGKEISSEPGSRVKYLEQENGRLRKRIEELNNELEAARAKIEKIKETLKEAISILE